MEGLSKAQYMEVVRLIEKMAPMGAFSYGIIAAIDEEKRMVKVVLEPYGVETGWCRVLQEGFCTKIGAEVLAAIVRGTRSEEYVILGIID